ncbi:hypothetical protein OIU35_22250 [Boseaceae bacterium BT-24-1]|nr:hypothetical protein [Boseaceae bacterium BT-24-1]
MSLYAAPDQAQPLNNATDVAALIRNHLRRRPAPVLPRGDRALLRLAAAIVALGLAGTGFALLATRSNPDAGTELHPTRVGDVVLAIPANLTGADSDEGRLVGMARLRLDWPSLGPVVPETRQRLLVTLSPPDKVNEPATQLSTYARFLTPTVWSNPGGLVVRGFRKGSPYEGDELYVSVPDGRGFAARCPVETAQSGLDEPCRVTFRHRGVDVNIRFPRAIVADWQVMIGGVRRSIDRLTR